MNADKIFDVIKKSEFKKEHEELNWTGSFKEYLDMVTANPMIARSAFQRTYDMIESYGYETYVEYKKEITHWKFWDDPIDNGKDAIFGLDVHLQKLVNTIKAGAYRYGPEKRVILLHGPVGSSKSTIARLLKKGLELYSRTPEGAMYSFDWKDIGDICEMENEFSSPMNEEPLLLIPAEHRDKIVGLINEDRARGAEIKPEGDLCPPSRYIYHKLIEHYDGDWEQVVNNHVHVRRLVLSEKDRIGVGTFQPKDEKNQDSTELTGDINYRKIAVYGSDSDPRAFNFDGEFNIAI